MWDLLRRLAKSLGLVQGGMFSLEPSHPQSGSLDSRMVQYGDPLPISDIDARTAAQIDLSSGVSSLQLRDSISLTRERLGRPDSHDHAIEEEGGIAKSYEESEDGLDGRVPQETRHIDEQSLFSVKSSTSEFSFFSDDVTMPGGWHDKYGENHVEGYFPLDYEVILAALPSLLPQVVFASSADVVSYTSSIFASLTYYHALQCAQSDSDLESILDKLRIEWWGVVASVCLLSIPTWSHSLIAYFRMYISSLPSLGAYISAAEEKSCFFELILIISPGSASQSRDIHPTAPLDFKTFPKYHWLYSARALQWASA